jgi:hypothetical protein
MAGWSLPTNGSMMRLLYSGISSGLQIFASTGADATTAAALGQSALLAYAVVMLVAALVDRRQPKRMSSL